MPDLDLELDDLTESNIALDTIKIPRKLADEPIKETKPEPKPDTKTDSKGKPPTELEVKAQELKDKIALPKKPGDKVQFRELLEWIKIIPDINLDKIMVYLYRLYPVINRQQADAEAPNNIDVYSGETLRHLTEDHVINTHGGGKYFLIVSDMTVKGKNSGQGFKANLYVPTINNPPKLDMREVVWDDMENRGYKAWCRSQKLIDDKNMPVEISTKNGSDDSAMVQAMKLAMDFAKNMSSQDQQELKRRIGAEDSVGKHIGDILLEKMKQDDPNKQVNNLAGVITAMKGLMPEQKPNNDNSAVFTGMLTMVTSMMTMMQESSKSQMQLMMKWMETSNSNKGEETDEVSKLKSILEIAKEIKGHPPDKGGVVEQLIEAGGSLLPHVFQTVNNIMQMNMLKQSGMNGMAGMQPKPTITPNPQPTNVNPNMQPNQQPQSNPQPAITGPTNDEATQIISQFGPLIIKHLANDGWEFGALVSDMFGDEIAAAAARHGVDGLITGAKSVPVFWSQVEQTYGEAHLRKWLASFCNYREEARKANEDDLELETEEDKKNATNL